MVPPEDKIDGFQLEEHEVADARNLDDENEAAYDDGVDISEGPGTRPEAGIVPDDPGEE